MSRLKRLLYMCEYPPSTLAGAPVIVKQLLSRYDPDSLEILCCGRMYDPEHPVVGASYLPSRHTVVANLQKLDVPPRRIFGPLWDTLNLCRIPRIVSLGERIVKERDIEAIFTIPWRCDFALSAFLLSRRTGLPLYVFETDHWEAMNPRLLPGRLVRRYHQPLLERAERLWLTSPAMVRRYQRDFDVEGEFLFHYLEVNGSGPSRHHHEPRGPADVLSLVYTGSVNEMFYDSLRQVCDLINSGLHVAGRCAKLTIYGASCPPELIGPNVTWKGLVPREDIPSLLAEADILLVTVTFSRDPRLVDLVRTSLYTKTVDYLAAARPVLIVSPGYSAQVDYFGRTAKVVDSADPARIRDGLAEVVNDPDAARERCRLGLELVRDRHSMEAMESTFLRHFRQPAEA